MAHGKRSPAVEGRQMILDAFVEKPKLPPAQERVEYQEHIPEEVALPGIEPLQPQVIVVNESDAVPLQSMEVPIRQEEFAAVGEVSAPPVPRIRMVAIDLDGTLLTDTKQVSEKTVKALRCLPASGVKVVIASARPPRSVRQFHTLLGLETVTINYNGALIWDEGKQEVVHHCPMEGELVKEMIGAARWKFPEVLVSCEVLDRWYTDRFEESYTTETGRLFKPDVIAPLEEFVNQPITKLLLLGEQGMISELTQELTNGYSDKAAVVRCDPELIQIMNRCASKAEALKKVAEMYGIPMEQVMAIGDAANDLEMLQEAGIAVAMDNAHPAVKAIADWVAPSNNDHGVHAALVQFGLCG